MRERERERERESMNVWHSTAKNVTKQFIQLCSNIKLIQNKFPKAPASPLDYLVSYVRTLVRGGLILLQKSNRCILPSKSTEHNIKRSFASCSRVCTIIWMHHMDANETHWEKARWKLHKNAASCLKQNLEFV